ncbi:unnamed protein product [Prunus armeniaca]
MGSDGRWSQRDWGMRLRIFSIERSCKRKQIRSNRQASDTSVVLAEGSPMLKEVKMRVLHEVSMWDFVQTIVDVTRVRGPRFCSHRRGTIVSSMLSSADLRGPCVDSQCQMYSVGYGINTTHAAREEMC